MNKFVIHMRTSGRGVWYLHQSKNVKREEERAEAINPKRAEALHLKKVDVLGLSMAKKLNAFCALFLKKRRRQRLLWIPNVSRQTKYNCMCNLLGVEHSLLGVEHSLLGVEHSLLGVEHSLLGVEHSLLGVEHSLLGVSR
jgi:hypothetical protein